MNPAPEFQPGSWKGLYLSPVMYCLVLLLFTPSRASLSCGQEGGVAGEKCL